MHYIVVRYRCRCDRRVEEEEEKNMFYIALRIICSKWALDCIRSITVFQFSFFCMSYLLRSTVSNNSETERMNHNVNETHAIDKSKREEKLSRRLM